jgi:hypothetical protein
LQFIRTKARFQFSGQCLCPGVGPDDGIVQWFSGFMVPDYGSFSLVRDSHGFDAADGMAMLFKGFYGAIDAGFNGSDDF